MPARYGLHPAAPDAIRYRYNSSGGLSIGENSGSVFAPLKQWNVKGDQMKTRLLAAACGLGLTMGTATVTTDAEARGPNPWTECGIGALIFSSVDGDAGVILAAISNLTWDLGTTGTSSATLSPDTCAGYDATAALFINQQLPSVETELAMGSGEHINAVMDIYQCSDSSQPRLLNDVRSQYGELLKDPAYSDWSHVQQAEAVWNIFNDTVNNDTTGSCAS